MDHPDEDAVIRYERWLKALQHLAFHGAQWNNASLAAANMLAARPAAAAMRGVLFTAAQQEGDAHLAALQERFPGVDLPALVHALRVRYVELRLGGR